MNRIFVYGTLMRGFRNHERYLAPFVLNWMPGEIKGHLYHLNYGCPAVLEGGEGLVKGEIYSLRDIERALPGIDYLEDFNQPGADNLYERKVVQAVDRDGNIMLCYVYFWSPRRTDELKNKGIHIIHGDWKKFLQERNCFPEEDDESYS